MLGKPSPVAKVRFTILDIEDNKPVYNACICIPEANAYFYTDNNGNTPLMEVPVLPNEYYNKTLKRNFGEITVLIYKEGYIDYILLNFTVKENEVRQGVKLLLYKKENSEQDFISIVETPDNNWIKSLIEKYRKK